MQKYKYKNHLHDKYEIVDFFKFAFHNWGVHFCDVGCELMDLHKYEVSGDVFPNRGPVDEIAKTKLTLYDKM